VPLGRLRAGDEAELVVERVSGAWKLVFQPGSVEVGGGRQLFGWNVLLASLCVARLQLSDELGPLLGRNQGLADADRTRRILDVRDRAIVLGVDLDRSVRR